MGTRWWPDTGTRAANRVEVEGIIAHALEPERGARDLSLDQRATPPTSSRKSIANGLCASPPSGGLPCEVEMGTRLVRERGGYGGRSMAPPFTRISDETATLNVSPDRLSNPLPFNSYANANGKTAWQRVHPRIVCLFAHGVPLFLGTLARGAPCWCRCSTTPTRWSRASASRTRHGRPDIARHVTEYRCRVTLETKLDNCVG